jgi:hypothetical protein
MQKHLQLGKALDLGIWVVRGRLDLIHSTSLPHIVTHSRSISYSRPRSHSFSFFCDVERKRKLAFLTMIKHESFSFRLTEGYVVYCVWPLPFLVWRYRAPSLR